MLPHRAVRTVSAPGVAGRGVCGPFSQPLLSAPYRPDWRDPPGRPNGARLESTRGAGAAPGWIAPGAGWHARGLPGGAAAALARRPGRAPAGDFPGGAL